MVLVAMRIRIGAARMRRGAPTLAGTCAQREGNHTNTPLGWRDTRDTAWGEGSSTPLVGKKSLLVHSEKIHITAVPMRE